MLEDKPIVTEKISESTFNIFFEPLLFDVDYDDLDSLFNDISEQTAWSVRLSSSKSDFLFGVIRVECNLAYRFEEDSLEESVKKVVAFLNAHPSYRATL